MVHLLMLDREGLEWRSASPLATDRCTWRDSRGSRAASSACLRWRSRRSRSDTCGADGQPSEWRAVVKVALAGGGLTHCVLPAVAVPSKTLVGNRCTSLRLNFLDTTAPWSSSNSSRALEERRDTHVATCVDREHDFFFSPHEQKQRQKNKEKFHTS